MKIINVSKKITIPEGVTVSIKSRIVTVKGPRGTIKREFKHLALDVRVVDNQVIVECWFGERKRIATITTLTTHIKNMMKGVTLGFKYKMRFVYAHFPINTAITDDKKVLEIRNFLGEKVVRRCSMLEGCTVYATGNKDEIAIEGYDLEKVSQSCANIHMKTLVKGKDIRKFLDGIYVSEKGTIKTIEQ